MPILTEQYAEYIVRPRLSDFPQRRNPRQLPVTYIYVHKMLEFEVNFVFIYWQLLASENLAAHDFKEK